MPSSPCATIGSDACLLFIAGANLKLPRLAASSCARTQARKHKQPPAWPLAAGRATARPCAPSTARRCASPLTGTSTRPTTAPLSSPPAASLTGTPARRPAHQPVPSSWTRRATSSGSFAIQSPTSVRRASIFHLLFIYYAHLRPSASICAHLRPSALVHCSSTSRRPLAADPTAPGGVAYDRELVLPREVCARICLCRLPAHPPPHRSASASLIQTFARRTSSHLWMAPLHSRGRGLHHEDEAFITRTRPSSR